MLNRQQQFGKKSERLAEEFLKRTGYRILETNYRSKMGEIDIIAMEKRTIVFVEVKARNTRRFGSPKGAVTPAKQRKISMAALDYLKRSGQTGASARFDVVAIDTASGKIDIEVVKNAFALAYG
ncbi:MAG: YraN family protein [Deltaproteobacteria bacterium]|uniref:YraN family protein n=1 Tax=uncultured Desulfosarcina sp. TaxID=218289 RepID=UPI0029C995B9|nr:YraN family protein [uncultured Desulfosarcina sp.]MCB2147683.1 YraN family protein [Deltaproteobacteria bacterium]